ncbi:hypothetical protein Aduo_007382 [Ancylostoma duodenale]
MPPRKGKKGRKTNEFIDVKKSGPEQWDSILYVHPKKLNEPCARIESDGEWFPIDRVLDSIYIVGTDKMWQHLVQWKPCWSRQVTPSALRDFHGRATVLGCVVKEDILRSRARQKVEWNRREFMCSNFMVRITDPDGTSAVEVMPYPDVKRRFPSALFDFLENKMPNPRVRDEERPRTDGLLSLYDDITIPECVNRDPDDSKIATKEAEEGAKESRDGSPADVPSLYKVGVEMKKKSKKQQWKGTRCRRKSKVNKQSEAEKSNDAEPKEAVNNTINPLNDVLNTTAEKIDVEEFRDKVKGSPKKSPQVRSLPGISPNSAKEFLNKLHRSKKSSPSKVGKSPDASSHNKETSTPLKSEKKSITPRSPRANMKDIPISSEVEDDVVVIEDENRPHPAKKSPPVKKNQKKSPGFHPNGKRTSKGSAPGSQDRRDKTGERRLRSPRLSGGGSSVERTPTGEQRMRSPRLSGGNSTKRTPPNEQRLRSPLSSGSSAKRADAEAKSRGCKRAAPLRSRNSLDNYFVRDNFKHRRISGEENGPKLETK